MYVGRIVALGRAPSGANAVAYRVSSRSFPNRAAVEQDGRLAIMPRPGHEADLARSPYIAYNCLRIEGGFAVASNGSHTDPIAEKLELGMPVRDALASTLLALDYEKDAYRTPRIAAVTPLHGDSGWLAVVRHDALLVRELPLEPGRAFYLATYEVNGIDTAQTLPFDARTAAEVARTLVDGDGFKGLEKPVTSAAALASSERFELATYVV
jgi:IMP cyclohydrolase